MATKKVYLRKVQKEATRKKQLATAKQLFCEHPYNEVTVQKIMKESGVGKGTYFAGFTCKEEIVGELERLSAFPGYEQMNAASGPYLEMIIQNLLNAIKNILESPHYVRAVIQTRAGDSDSKMRQSPLAQQVNGMIFSLIDKAIKNGELDSSTEPLWMLQVVEQVYLGMLMQRSTMDNPLEILEAIEESIRLVFSLFTPKAKKESP